MLLITFNRPDHTRQVWNEIKKQKPKYLFVFQDGSRPNNKEDIEKVEQVRALFNPDEIDWECELKTNFNENNLGCGRGPAAAITWFFDNVEEGLIFEDDCLPTPEFFQYTSMLLEKYRDNDKVSFIGGTNYQDGIKRGDASYYFSAGHHGTWGWGSWRRVWNKFDYRLSNIDEKDAKEIFKNYFPNLRQREYWMNIFEKSKLDQFDNSAWDYQFYISCWKHNMLAVIPNVNLISNIGFDDEATHTTAEDDKFASNKTSTILPLTFNLNLVLDTQADYYLHRFYVQSYEYGWSGIKRLPFRINKRIKRALGIKGSWFK